MGYLPAAWQIVIPVHSRGIVTVEAVLPLALRSFSLLFESIEGRGLHKFQCQEFDILKSMMAIEPGEMMTYWGSHDLPLDCPVVFG